MEQITITLTREELNLIKDALNTYAVQCSSISTTVGVDCRHPDIWHREWIDATNLWCKVYETLNPETEKED